MLLGAKLRDERGASCSWRGSQPRDELRVLLRAARVPAEGGGRGQGKNERGAANSSSVYMGTSQRRRVSTSAPK